MIQWMLGICSAAFSKSSYVGIIVDTAGKGDDGMNCESCTEIHIHTAAAAAAKSLQSCPTLCNPIDGLLGNKRLSEDGLLFFP